LEGVSSSTEEVLNLKTLTALLIVFSLSLCFALTLNVGKNLNFEEILGILTDLSNVLNIQPPSTNTIGSFVYIVWEDHIVSKIKGGDLYVLDNEPFEGGIPTEDLLKRLKIPYHTRDNEIIVPDTIIKSIEMIGRSLVVEYTGKGSFDFEMTNDGIVLISIGEVFFNGNVYGSGKTFGNFPVKGFKIDSIHREKGKVIVNFKESGIRTIKIRPINERIDPFDPNLTILVGYGDGRIIFRNFVPDFKGVDWKVYSETKKIVYELARELGYLVEECPVYKLPIGVPCFIVLIKKPDDLKLLNEYLKELLKE